MSAQPLETHYDARHTDDAWIVRTGPNMTRELWDDLLRSEGYLPGMPLEHYFSDWTVAVDDRTAIETWTFYK